MNKLIATMVASAFAVASSGAWGQAAAPATSPKDKGEAAAYQNPAAEKTQAQKSKSAAEVAAKSKMQQKTKSKYDEQAAMAVSGSAASEAASAKASVDASKKTARQKPKNIKDMTPEERAALQKQMKEQAKP